MFLSLQPFFFFTFYLAGWLAFSLLLLYDYYIKILIFWTINKYSYAGMPVASQPAGTRTCLFFFPDFLLLAFTCMGAYKYNHTYLLQAFNHKLLEQILSNG